MPFDAEAFYIHGVQDGLELASDVGDMRGKVGGIVLAQIIDASFLPVYIGRFRLPAVNLQQFRIVLPAHIQPEASRMPKKQPVDSAFHRRQFNARPIRKNNPVLIDLYLPRGNIFHRKFIQKTILRQLFIEMPQGQGKFAVIHRKKTKLAIPIEYIMYS